jgi:arsenite oxidase large subunit
MKSANTPPSGVRSIGADIPSGRVPLPPPDARVQTTVCEYCPVGCGYKVYTWPLGADGGLAEDENAFGVAFPAGIQSGKWPSPNMHNVVMVGGEPQNVIVIPDADSKVVNVGGDHSIRGGAIAQKLYSSNKPTADRLTHPLLRVRGSLQPIPWDAATTIVAEVSKHVLQNHGELAWGMKVYYYQFFENTYAATKLALAKIGTPCIAPHHAPADGSDTPGLDDAGIDAFSAAYEDGLQADVLFVAGSDPYETKTVRFLQWMRGRPIIYVDPRRTFTAAFAEAKDGLHLQIRPGTDTALYNAIARLIIENGWEDREFIDARTASAEEIQAEKSWRRRKFGLSFDQLREYLLSQEAFTPGGAELVTGVPADKIRLAAEMVAKPAAGGRPKVNFLFEKGLYWAHNYENTAAIANLAVLTGSTGRPGRAIARMGGHQRGMIQAAKYPKDKSPHAFEGNKIELDLDRWVVEGNLRFAWVVGTNWVNAMACSQHLAASLRNLVLDTRPQITSADPATAIAQLKERIDNGGMALVHQEIYENDTTEFADLVLPAATWGEEDFARNNAERRLRIYERFMDPPGEAKPDWRIFADVAKKMGYDGFDWVDSNAVFEEAAEASKGSRKDYAALVEKARADGKRGHDLLREFGTQGLQTPLKLEGGKLVETVRFHSDLKFKTESGKANFVLADWLAVDQRNTLIGPRGDELWVTNGRINDVWNNLFDFTRRPYSTQRFPMNFLEINPADAETRGIESGDLVRVDSDHVLNHTGQETHGEFTAVAYVSDIVPAGVTFAYFHWPKSPANAVVSANTALQPVNLRYHFKLGAGRVTRLGSTELKGKMSFAPRNLA